MGREEVAHAIRELSSHIRDAYWTTTSVADQKVLEEIYSQLIASYTVLVKQELAETTPQFQEAVRQAKSSVEAVKKLADRINIIVNSADKAAALIQSVSKAGLALMAM